MLVKVVHIGGLLMKIYSFIILVLPTFVCAADLPEMVIGEKDIEPGISLIFEGAIKDDVAPSTIFGLEADSDIHIEVVATWNENGPRGSVNGGFVAYLDITALITNKVQVKKDLFGWIRI